MRILTKVPAFGITMRMENLYTQQVAESEQSETERTSSNVMHRIKNAGAGVLLAAGLVSGAALGYVGHAVYEWNTSSQPDVNQIYDNLVNSHSDR